MDTKLAAFPLPILHPYIRVINELRDKKIYVIISPNEDYLLADIFIGFASLGSGALGMIKSLSSLELLIRTLSFMKNAKEITDKLKGVIEESSITIPPRMAAEVYNALMNDPLMWLKPIGIINLFGGKGLSILITDEDFKNTVMFNTALEKEYFVNEEGVRDPMHIWNGGRTNTGRHSNVAPSLVIHNNKMLMLYKDVSGKRIYITEFVEGNFANLHHGFLHHDSSTGISAAVQDGKLVIAGRDSTGTQMYCLFSHENELRRLEEFGFKWMGQDINSAPAIAVKNNEIFAVGKNGNSNHIVWVNLNNNKHTWGKTEYKSLYPPAIQTFKGEVYMAYVDTLNQNIDLAIHTHAGWKRIRSVGFKTSSGPALVVYKDRLYIIFRDQNGNGIFYIWTDDCKTFKQSRDGVYTGLDSINNAVAAAPMPGGNGIMIAGIMVTDSAFSRSQDIVWKILMPYEGNSFRTVKAATRAVKNKVEDSENADKPAKAKPVAKKKTVAEAKPLITETGVPVIE